MASRAEMVALNPTDEDSQNTSAAMLPTSAPATG